jgi:hypothetical protein
VQPSDIDLTLPTPAGALTLRGADEPGERAAVLAFIRARFQEHYGAEVADDAPLLVGARDPDGALVAAFGLRTRTDGFFCEHYLDGSLPNELAARFHRPVSPEHIVEVAHLCAVRPGFLRTTTPVLAGALAGIGMHYLACTATECLARYFERKGLPARVIAEADPGRLPPEERSRWGRYYATRPRVLVGDLAAALAALAGTRPAREQAR